MGRPFSSLERESAMSIARSKSLVRVLFMILLACCLGCGSNDKKPTTPAGDVGEYLGSLPSWSEFSPLQEETEPIQVGDPVASADTVDVTRYTENGGTEVIPDVRYSCTETEYSITKNPSKFVMCGGPNVDMLWPGALVQGRSLRDSGNLLPLTIQQRVPIKVSIPALATAENYRTVVPSQATVASAIGEIIGNATQSEIDTPSSISCNTVITHSEEEFALECGMSGRYLNFELTASGGYSESVEKTTVTIQFYQWMFDAVIEPPQTPGSFFSDAFTKELLQEQVALGRIGPDNLPIYVSKVVYGRMLMFTMTSSASQEEIMGTLSLAADYVEAGGSLNLSVKQQTILQNAEYQIASLGGSAENVLSIIRSGDWTQYFTADPALSTAAPLCYEFRNLGDGSIALVSETTHYTKKVCQAVTSTMTFGSSDWLDQNGDQIPDRFCPQPQHGCDFLGSPTVDLETRYEIDETTIRVFFSMQAYRGDIWAYSQWSVDLLQAPSGTRIQAIDGMTPSEWAAANSVHRNFNGGSGHSGDIYLGIATFQIIGDTANDDICGTCDDERCGIWGVKFRETPVDLSMSCSEL